LQTSAKFKIFDIML